MMWALVQNGVVSEVTDINPDGRFHPDFQWEACGDDVSTGWSYVDGEFIPAEEDAQASNTACTQAQGLIALFVVKQITEAHVLEAIEKIADPVQRYTILIGYQRATTWERDSPTMQAMADLLQLNSDDMDDLFAHAVTVQV